jgi:hypothetical protein
MLNIRTRIWTDLNPSKRIRSRIRSENICTVFIPTYEQSTVRLQGQLSDLPVGSVIQVAAVFPNEAEAPQPVLPPEVS